MTDLIPASFADEMRPFATNQDDIPPVFALDFRRDFRRVGFSAGLAFVGNALRNNTTVSWFTVGLTISEPIDYTDESVEDLHHFLSNKPRLKVFEVFTNLRIGHPTHESFIQGVIAAAAKNEHLEKILLKGWACNHVSGVVTSRIKEIELQDIPSDFISDAWPLLPSTVSTLRLSSENMDRKNGSVATILDKMAKTAHRVCAASRSTAFTEQSPPDACH